MPNLKTGLRLQFSLMNTSQIYDLLIDIVISTVFESKDKPTQMTKQSFTIVDFITYRKSIHFELICKDVHN